MIRVALIVVLAAAFQGPIAAAQGSTTVVSQVHITVVQDGKPKQTSGKLYRLAPGTDRRLPEPVEVDDNGKISKPVECTTEDRFESQADHPFAMPIEPYRATCASTLRFQFQAFRITWTQLGTTPVSTSDQYKLRFSVFSNVGEVAAKNGDIRNARAASEMKVSAVAQYLGDTDLVRFVQRDPAQGFKMILNEDGVEALKRVQAESGIPITGRLDFATEKQILLKFDERKPVRTNCTRTGEGAYSCVLQ